MLNKIFLFSIIFFWAFAVSGNEQSNECLNDWGKTQKKIGDLEKEVICSNQDSWKDCFSLFHEGHQNNLISFKKVNENYANLANDGTLLLSCPTHSAALTDLTIPFLAIPPSIRAISHYIETKNSHFTKRPFVNSVEDFYHHMQLHRKRVVTIGTEAFKQFPELFPDLNLELIHEVLGAHDLAKVETGVLASNREPFYKVLYEKGYGKQIDPKWVQELNSRDERFMESAYQKFGLSKEKAMNEAELKLIESKRKQILKLEKISDLMDRVNNSVSSEEFGRPMFAIGENFKDEELRPVIAFLEKNYSTITSNLNYTPFSKDEAAELFIQLRRNEILWGLKNKGYSDLSISSLKSLAKFKSREFLGKAIEMLTSKSAMKLFAIADGVTLFFSDMDRIGCSSQMGSFDWRKEDGICKPIIGLTPGFLKFLYSSGPEQKNALHYYPHQCNVLQLTHALQNIDRFEKKECLNQGVNLTLPNHEGNITVQTNGQKPESIIFKLKDGHGPKLRIEHKLNGEFNHQEKCFEIENTNYHNCYTPENESKMTEYEKIKDKFLKDTYKGLSFYIFKALNECSGKNLKKSNSRGIKYN